MNLKETLACGHLLRLKERIRKIKKPQEPKVELSKRTNLLFGAIFTFLISLFLLDAFRQIWQQFNFYVAPHPSDLLHTVKTTVWFGSHLLYMQTILLGMPWLIIVGLASFFVACGLIEEFFENKIPEVGKFSFATDGYVWTWAAIGVLAAGLLLQQMGHSIHPRYGVAKSWGELGGSCIKGGAVVVGVALAWLKAQPFFSKKL